jgi:F-type H+-transporting ATPase subunit delta
MKATKQARREATQLFRFCHIRGSLNENLARNIVQQFAAAKPRGYLGVLSHFRRLVKLDRAMHTARVESAKPLAADLQTRLRTDLARQYGAGLNTSFAENPSLIGGMRVQVGSDVYDGTVRSRLAALEQSF